MFNLFLGVFVLGVLVFIHELGHFLAAKLCKIPVLTFSIGFGPKIFSKKIGDTEYQIAAIPFGGFVAMDGGDLSNSTENHSIPRRAIVAVAGPLFNIVSAYMFLVLAFMNGVTHAPYLDTNLVGLVSEESSAWGKIEQGDRIISINGKDVSNWTDINAKFNDMSIDYSLILLRGDDTVSTSVHIPLPDPKLLEAKSSGIFPPIPAVIGRVDENSAAYNAGFLAGDSIISINEEEVLSWFAVSETIAGYNDSLGEIFIKVARGGEIMDLSVRPNFNREHRRYMIGIVMANPSTEIKRHGLASALSLAYRECIRYSVLIFETLQKLVTRKISPDYLSGPVGIMQMSGAAVQSGLSSLLQLLALIGINLGLLNLMPLVITDGGVLSLLLIEAVRRKPIPIVLREKLSYIVMVAFLCLAVFVTFNDIMRFETIEKLLNFR